MGLTDKVRNGCKYDCELLSLLGQLSFHKDPVETQCKIEITLSYIEKDYGVETYHAYKEMYDAMLNVRLRLENADSLLKY